jgi:hypothetical protein
MQSSLWVSRPTGEDYGVTGGGALEFLATKIPAGSIKNVKAVIPNANTLAELRAMVQAARDLALAEDPVLKAQIDAATDPKIKKDFEGMIPNLTDMFIRGDAGLNLKAKIKKMLSDIKTATEKERATPAAPRAPGPVSAPTTKKKK